MPFGNKNGYEFTELGIARSAPRASGVYGIYNSQAWIYVGEAEDIEVRLYAHLRGESDQSKCILGFQPTGFTFDVYPELVRNVRERALIRELRPACNIQGV